MGVNRVVVTEGLAGGESAHHGGLDFLFSENEETQLTSRIFRSSSSLRSWRWRCTPSCLRTRFLAVRSSTCRGSLLLPSSSPSHVFRLCSTLKGAWSLCCVSVICSLCSPLPGHVGISPDSSSSSVHRWFSQKARRPSVLRLASSRSDMTYDLHDVFVESLSDILLPAGRTLSIRIISFLYVTSLGTCSLTSWPLLHGPSCPSPEWTFHLSILP